MNGKESERCDAKGNFTAEAGRALRGNFRFRISNLRGATNAAKHRKHWVFDGDESPAESGDKSPHSIAGSESEC